MRNINVNACLRRVAIAVVALVMPQLQAQDDWCSVGRAFDIGLLVRSYHLRFVGRGTRGGESRSACRH